MIESCFEYTKDVARHERLRLEGKDDEILKADAQRTITHEGVMIAISAYRSVLEEKGLDNPDEPEVIPRKSQDRVHFGKFAILVTLNRFKEQISLISQIKEQGSNIDYSKLKSLTKNETELLIIEYVQTLSTLFDNEDKSGKEENILHDIESKLNQDETHILQAFMDLYEKSYK